MLAMITPTGFDPTGASPITVFVAVSIIDSLFDPLSEA
jgi:hypothetical protein